jgi:hypothetical protein
VCSGVASLPTRDSPGGWGVGVVKGAACSRSLRASLGLCIGGFVGLICQQQVLQAAAAVHGCNIACLVPVIRCCLT